ncbi:MAG: tetratricopeptide repeat protein [Deltaproteobacteria bacterium]
MGYTEFTYGRDILEFFDDHSCYLQEYDIRRACRWTVLNDGRIKIEMNKCGTELVMIGSQNNALLQIDMNGEYMTFVSAYSMEAGRIEKEVKAANMVLEAERLFSREGKYDEAIVLLKEASSMGNAKAQDLLGRWYLYGFHLPRDTQTAITLLQKAADQGLVGAQYQLAWIYATSRNPKDSKKAITYALNAVSQKEGNWQYVGVLAVAYARDGQYTKAVVTQEKALHLLSKDETIPEESKLELYAREYEALKLYRNKQAYDVWRLFTISGEGVKGSGLEYIPSLNADITQLRFFESNSSTQEKVYTNRFPQSKAKYLSWELLLKHPAPPQKIDFKIHAIYYKPDGSILTEQIVDAFLPPHQTYSSWNEGFGEKYGGKWHEGDYTVELFVDEIEITSGAFSIYSDVSEVNVKKK